jgi:hypothetical protein
LDFKLRHGAAAFAIAFNRAIICILLVLSIRTGPMHMHVRGRLGKYCVERFHDRRVDFECPALLKATKASRTRSKKRGGRTVTMIARSVLCLAQSTITLGGGIPMPAFYSGSRRALR